MSADTQYYTTGTYSFGPFHFSFFRLSLAILALASEQVVVEISPFRMGRPFKNELHHQQPLLRRHAVFFLKVQCGILSCGKSKYLHLVAFWEMS